MRAPPIEPPITEAETCKEVASGVKEEGIEVVSGYEEVVEVVGMAVR